MKPLLSQVEATLQKYKMLVPEERLLVACSGGADSVALFHLLREIASRWRIRLHLIHFDHALRRGSAGDFKFVQKLARDFKIPFYGGRKKGNRRPPEKNLSPEEQARMMRYEFFEKAARKARIYKVALGHHRDDQAETVLMRLVQGTGLRGLQGIRPVVEVNGITYIRPLLGVGRAEILGFLKKHSLSHREDLTNRSERFLRNRIRKHLLPLLERKFNPQIRGSLCRLAETSTSESAGLDDWVRRFGKNYIRSRRKNAIWFDRERVLSLPNALQFRLFDQALHLLNPRSGLDFKSWERVEEGIQKGRLRMTLPRNLDLNLTPKKLFVRKNDTMRTTSSRKST